MTNVPIINKYMKTFKTFLKEEYHINRVLITEDKIGKAVSLFSDIMNIKNKLENINPKLTDQIFNSLSDILEHYKGNIERKRWDRIIVKDFITMMSDRFKNIIGRLKKNLIDKTKKFTEEQKQVIQGFIDNLERLVKEISNFYKIAITS